MSSGYIGETSLEGNEKSDSNTPSKKEIDKYYLNERFQAIVEKPTVTLHDLSQRKAELNHFVNAFNQLAKEFVYKILSREINQLGHQVGRAGGIKYKDFHIFAKLAIDQEETPNWIYGGKQRNDELAMKSANNELRALNAIVSCGLKMLHVPFTAVITTRGYRVSCIANLPITEETRIYGSSVPSPTKLIIKSKEFVSLLEIIAKRFHLKKHGTMDPSTKQQYENIWDMEGHIGEDGRMYVVDTARFLPPMQYIRDKSPPNSSIYNLIRSDLLLHQNYPNIELNSDLYRVFNVEDIHDLENTEKVTNFLVTFVVPHFAKMMESIVKTPDFNLTKAIHAEGIPVRFLGLLLHHVFDNQHHRYVVLENILSRAFCNILNSRLRALRDKGNDKIIYIAEVNDCLKKLLTVDANFWDELKEKIRNKFFISVQPIFDVTLEFEKLMQDIRNIRTHNVLKIIEEIMGVTIKTKDGMNWEIEEEPYKIKTIELSPWLANVSPYEQSQLFTLYEQTYLELLKTQTSQARMFTLTHLGDLYASQSVNGASAKKAEEYYIEAYKEMREYKKLDFGSKDYDEERHKRGISFELRILYAANIMDKLGDLYLREELFNAAQNCYDKSLVLKKMILGDASPHLACTMIQSAQVLWKRGEFKHADGMFRNAATLSEASLNYGILINNLVPYLLQTGNLNDALVYAEAAKKIFYDHNRGLRSLEYGIACDNYGQALLLAALAVTPVNKSRLEKAVENFEAAMYQKGIMIGTDNVFYAAAVDHLATARALHDYFASKIANDYEEQFQVARKLFEQKIGSSSSSLAKSWNNCVLVPLVMKNKQEAQSRLEKANKIVHEMSKSTEKRMVAENIQRIVSYNLKCVESMDIKTFQVARHDAYLGVSEKGFQMESLPVEIKEFISETRKVEPDTIERAEDLLVEFAKIVSQKIIDPNSHRTVLQGLTNVFRRIESALKINTNTPTPPTSSFQVSQPLVGISKKPSEVVYDVAPAIAGSANKETPKELLTKEEKEKLRKKLSSN